ncbi:MAG: histidine kinase [Eubacteriales bacterium]
MKKKKHTKLREFSLGKVLAQVVIFCWIMPIVIVFITLGYYSNQQVNKGVIEEITTSAEYAITLSQQNIDSMINDSKEATYDGMIEAAYKEYQRTDSAMKLYSSTTDYLSSAYRYNDLFYDTIIIYDQNKDTTYYTTYYKTTSDSYNARLFVETYMEELGVISEEIGTGIGFELLGEEMYMVRNIVNDKFEPYAMLIMRLNTEEIFQSVYNLPLAEEVNLAINNQEILRNDAFDEKLENEELENQNSRYFSYEQEVTSGDHIFQYSFLLNTNVLNSNLHEIQLVIVCLSLLIVPLVLFVVYIFLKHFSSPVKQLVRAASKIEEGELGYNIDTKPYSTEFSYLTDRFNSMSQSMKEQFDLIYSEQEALQNAKIKALQSQINPHFLNNTLEVINWELRLGENQKAIEMIESLSTMLNASMARNEKSSKRLKEELMYVDAYLMIISTRMGKRLTILREIDESITDCEVPLLILQPIVENAIEHGIAKKTTGVLIIRVYETEDANVVEIENDNPLSQEDKKRIDALLNWEENEEEGNIGHSSLGIRNVNERLKLIFGEEHGLTITLTEGGNTLSRICFPKGENAQNEINEQV